MYKTTNKHKRGNHHSEFDVYGDIEKIKELLAKSTYDIKGRTNEILNESLNSVRERTADVKDTTAEYVAEKPFKSMGLAMLAGAVIGYFLLPRK